MLKDLIIKNRSYRRFHQEIPINKETLIDLIDLENIDPPMIEMGKPRAMTGAASAQYVIHAADLALQGNVDAIVTAPLNKEAMHLGGYNYPGHTELLAEKSGTDDYAMMLVSGKLRVVHATTHVPFRDIIKHLSPERNRSHPD